MARDVSAIFGFKMSPAHTLTGHLAPDKHCSQNSIWFVPENPVVHFGLITEAKDYHSRMQGHWCLKTTASKKLVGEVGCLCCGFLEPAQFTYVTISAREKTLGK